MPFDPHIIPAEEPPLDEAGELLLPDDLAELAAQLGEDAQHLSACYPAKPTSHMPGFEGLAAGEIVAQRNTPSTIRRMVPALTAAALVAGLLTTIDTWRWGMEGHHEPNKQPVVAEAKGDDTTSPQGNILGDNVRLPGEAASVPNATGRTPSPAFFLQEYSGPELEGIYDLLGESGDDKISI